MQPQTLHSECLNENYVCEGFVKKQLNKTQHINTNKGLPLIIKRSVLSSLVAIALTMMASSARGDLLFIAMSILRLFNMDGLSSYFENFFVFLAVSWLISIITYFPLGGFLQYWYYIRQKDRAQEWKCQPTRWLTKENERHEILSGTFNVCLGATFSTFVQCGVVNKGWSLMYHDPLQYGILYLLISIPAMFIASDAFAYYIHRALHGPVLYKTFHKWHHRYNSPTAFSATAMHPVEFLWIQSGLIAPIFFIPMYSGVFIGVILYSYYYGMIDHSGIKMPALWPWQPHSYFHDDHHRYFHVNFGFNLVFWDKLHGTLRRRDREYGEDIFGGKGKTDGATKQETDNFIDYLK